MDLDGWLRLGLWLSWLTLLVLVVLVLRGQGVL
jgi:hypothetical protein